VLLALNATLWPTQCRAVLYEIADRASGKVKSAVDELLLVLDETQKHALLCAKLAPLFDYSDTIKGV
jgi:hypothetical protein